MAFDLVAAYADSIQPFYQKDVSPAVVEINEAPQQITLRFSPGVRIDPASLADNIAVVSTTGTVVDVGLLVDDSPNENQVIVRFKEAIRDGSYQINVGAGLRSLSPDDSAVPTAVNVRVNLGAFVVGVVPQPVVRGQLGNLIQARGQIEVYFNTEDPLKAASVQNVNSYRLFQVDTNTNADVGSPVSPTAVTYDATVGKATLFFGTPLRNAAGLYRLEIGGSTASTPAAFFAEGDDNNSSFTTAQELGTLGASGATVVGEIESRPTLPTPVSDLEFPVSPGALDTPGHRDVPVDSGSHGVPPFAIVDPVTGVTAVAYNFRSMIGTDPQGNLLPNVITEAQKQRAREIFELFSLQSGVRFVETPDQGLMVATGDLRAFNPNIPAGAVAGLGGGSGALMNSLINWGDSEYGGQWFRVAMHEIGHALGLPHSYDLPSIMGADLGGEPIFPGDYDFEHLRQLYPSSGSDIDLYKFALTEAGRFTAEIVVARPGMPVTSSLDTVLSLYREYVKDGRTVRTLIARNDDYYGRDSFVGLDLEAGSYHIAVTSTGNTAFDPAISDSGANGRTEGGYELKLGFTPVSAASNTIVDMNGTPLDGDRDGVKGGAFRFWFNAAATADTIYVDKVSPVAGDGIGSLASPFKTIRKAMEAVTANTRIIRIAGNSSATPYLIGTDLAGRPLADGATFDVPTGVTVMIDAGAVFKLRAANIDVGSSSQLVSRAGAAIQVLGVPPTGSAAGAQVTFTSWHDDAVGGNSDGAGPAVQGGQWGGIVLRQDSDAASKRAFVNSISGAAFRYGGGQVAVDGVLESFAPIQIESTRPTVIFNTISDSAGAALAATPNSFEDTGDRFGPEFRGNRLVANSINGLFVKIDTQFGTPLDRLDVPARFKSTDLVYVIQENLVINGGVGGYTSTVNRLGNLMAGGTQVTGLAKTSDLLVGMQVEIRDPANPGVSALPPGAVTIVSIDSPTSITLSAAPLVTAKFANVNFRDDDAGPARYEYAGDVTISSGLVTNLPSTAGLSVGMRVEIVDAANPGTTLLPGGFAEVLGIIDGTTVLLTQSAASTRAGARVTFIDQNAPLGFARDSGRLTIDPGVIVKLQGSRIELERGIAQIVAEGRPGKPVIFTSLGDNRYGAGGTFDTNGNVPDKFDAVGRAVQPLTLGDWGGIILNAGAKASIDRAYLAFGGGETPIEGGFDNFNVIEVHQGDLRITNSRIENNAGGTARTDRTGRGGNAAATVFVRGAQPIIVGNDFRTNLGAVISINANSLSDVQRGDAGRSTGNIDRFDRYDDNFGPLVRGNTLAYGTGGQAITGMVVRGGEITVESVWDDTDIVHVLQDEIIVHNFHTATGIRLLSKTDASLIVKLFGNSAGFTAGGENLDIYDRIGGTVQIVGQPGYPVVLTSLRDDSVGASTDPLGRLVKDTNVDGVTTVSAAGDWRSLRFLPFSNDRNVSILTEREKAYTGGIDSNGGTSSAEWLGVLAPNYATGNNTWDSAQEKSADENRRLGFEVHGNVAYDDAGDLDVYTFLGYAGSEAWIDIDKTSPALDSMVELLDAAGNVLARSVDAGAEGGVVQGELVEDFVGGTTVTYDFAPGGLTTGDFSLLAGTLSGVVYDGVAGAARAIQTFSVDANGQITFQSILGNDRLGAPNTIPAIAGGSDSYATGGSVDLANGQLTLTFSDPAGNGTGILASQVEVRYAYKTPAITAVSGIAQTLGKESWRGGDYFTQNPRDPGMRVMLPGVQGVQTRYYIRVRSQPRYEPDSTTIDNGGVTATTDTQFRTDVSSTAVDNGATSGRYELRVRLRQQDEKPGSTVRYADIRYPTIGIDVQGLPSNSPLVADTGENPTDTNNTFANAQYIGNVLESSRGALSVAGTMADENDVDWYTFALNYEQIQAIPGVNDSGFSWATVFDIDYADGFRGDLTMSVFDSTGRLIYVGRDSGVTDDQPGAQQGNDFDNLAAGSAGKLDPFIGTVTLGAGGPTGGGGGDTGQPVTPPDPTAQLRYYVAISSNERLPAQLNATFGSTAANALVRLEPIASVDRIVTDRIGDPEVRYPGVAAAERLIDITTTPLTLDAYVRPFTLSDVTLFVTTTNSLVTVDAMRGGVETIIEDDYGVATTIGDMVMRSDGNLYIYRGVDANATTAGQLARVDSGGGDLTVIGNDQVKTPIQATQINLAPVQTGTVPTTTFDLTGRFLRPPQDAAITGTVRYRWVDTSVTPNVIRGGTWDFTAAAAAINGLATLTFTPVGTPDPLLGTAPNDARSTVNLDTGIVSINWGPDSVDTAGVRLTTISYEYTFQDVATDVVDAVAWRRAGVADYQNLVYSIWDPGSGQSFLYQANPANGSAAYVNNQNWGIQGTLTSGGVHTSGLAWLGGTLYGVDTAGNLFSITNIDDGDFALTTTPIATILGVDGNPVAFQGLTVGPVNLQGGDFANLLFGIDGSGNLYCFDTAGNLQTVFDGDGDGVPEAASIATGAGGARGLAFSPLDVNLWHPTTRRGGDAGGGTSPTERKSMYFGFEEFQAVNPTYGGHAAVNGQYGAVSGTWQQDLSSNAAIGNNYNLPGGAYGSLLTDEFSLGGYEYTDKPTLYFDYWLQTQDATGTRLDSAMRDSARVFASIDGGLTWELLTTNNSLPSTSNLSDRELPNFASTSSKISDDTVIQNQHVQEMYDTSNWRQARVDLGKFAGEARIRLRFDFSTAGTFDPTQQTADVDGDGVNDPINAIVNDTTGKYGQPAAGLANATGNFNSAGRGQANGFEGFYIDDIMIGFAERGEAVSNAVPGATTFFDVATPGPNATVAAQVLNGPYQLEIRRGTELSAVALPDTLAQRFGEELFPETFDTNARLVAARSTTTAYGAKLGDENQPREQGQFIVEGNIVVNASQYGIRIDAAARDGGSNAPHPGTPRMLPTLNNHRLAAGAVVANNVVARAGVAGILFSGDPNTGNVPQAAVPYGRIVNNTIYGGETTRGVGVQVSENAGPTLLNNLFANLAQAITVDGSSASRTVVGTSAYWNSSTATGVAESNAIVLASNPFANPTRNNFYLTAGSRAIDSSLDVLQDRNEFVQVNSPIGITAAPVISPERDLYGQLRSDDPGVTNLSGLGNNVFKDRGAIDRVDFAQPRASLATPLDGGPMDRDPSPNAVVLAGDSRGLTRFELQLDDVGVGIDKSTVVAEAFTLTRNGVTLAEGVDYLFTYLESSNRVVFEAAATFALGSYTITATTRPSVDEVPGLLTDLANNTLLPNRTDGSTVFTINLAEAPGVPTAVTGEPFDSAVLLSWQPPASQGSSAIIDYVVQYSTDGTTWVTFPHAVSTATVLMVTGLTNDVGYRFRVAAVNSIGQGDFSDPSAVIPSGVITPAALVPRAPTNVVAVRGNTTAEVTWVPPTASPAAPITEYRLQYSINGGATWTRAFTPAPITGTSVTLTGLTNGLPHIFRVRAVNRNGLGAWSAPSAPVTPLAPAAAPSITSLMPSSRAITAAWTTPSGNGSAITGYVVQWSTGGTSPRTQIGVQNSYTIPNLVNGTPYTVRVAALTAFGRGAWSAWSSAVTPVGVADAPTGLTALSRDASVLLSWAAPADSGGRPITTYVVQYRLASASTWSTFARPTSTVTSQLVTGLANGSQYVFRVAAVTSMGTGAYAGPIGPVTPLPLPSAPTRLTGTAGVGTVSLVWTAPASTGGYAITDYLVQSSIDNGATWMTVSDGVSTIARATVTVPGGRTYLFRVAAITAAGMGNFSLTSPPLTPA